MSEHPFPTDPSGNDSGNDPSARHEPTGHADVDAVVASLDELDDRPVSAHVAAFESAHARLRSALSDAGPDAEPDPAGA